MEEWKKEIDMMNKRLDAERRARMKSSPFITKKPPEKESKTKEE